MITVRTPLPSIRSKQSVEAGPILYRVRAFDCLIIEFQSHDLDIAAAFA